MSASDQIEFNKKVHDAVATDYERLHTEIFNPIEQDRLQQALRAAVVAIDSTKVRPKVLDVGCGSGNLTQHLLKLGVAVTAADISQVFLTRITKKHPEVKTHVLNGTDLSEISDDTFDMVATYSVLHHIPDYLKMVEEMCRVLKSGGVLYIDHEKNDHYWNQSPELMAFYHTQRLRMIPSMLRKLVTPMWYVHRVRRYTNPRYQAEGDIHVWPDDHIEWDTIYSVCRASGVEIVKEMNFLLYDARYNKKDYEENTNTITDTRAVIMRKL